MEETLIAKKLMAVDKELHSLILELTLKKRKKVSLSELNAEMEKDRISDEDSTKLIREMRDRI